MVGDSTLPVRAAIVAALRADAAVGAIMGDRIYSRAPDAVVFPYSSFGPVIGEPWEGATLSGWEQSAQIDTWSRQPGGVEALSAMAAIGAALHRAPLAVAGHEFVLINLELQTLMNDPDGVTTHGVQRFRILTHKET